MDINKTIKFTYITSDFTKSDKKEEERVIEGYASTHDIDRQYEVITPDAMKKAVDALLTTNTTVFYEHKHEQFPVGRILDAKVDEKGLWIKVLISKTADNVWTLIKEGILNKFSIGGKVKDYHRKFSKDLGRDITYVTDMELYEVSIVGLPANQNASFKAKSLTSVIVKALEGREKLDGALKIIEGGVKEMGDEKKEIIDNKEQVIEKSVQESVIEAPKVDAPITQAAESSQEPQIAVEAEVKSESVVEKAVEPKIESEPKKELTKEDIENLLEKKEKKEVKKEEPLGIEVEPKPADKMEGEEEAYYYADATEEFKKLHEHLDSISTSLNEILARLGEVEKTSKEPKVEKAVEVQKLLTAEDVTSIVEKAFDTKVGKIRLVPSRKGTIIKTDLDVKDSGEDGDDLNTLHDEEKFKTLSKDKQQDLIRKGLTLAIRGR